ncbi:mycothiol system anti-sigma-R factor [Smaragdicoccus niigatensis]|uniref:mycothiol system anti-sigma-R factor n=1 Tax=Smaragdicoccus niigatensis TaxID=359359 RepID=UPI0003790858|nr:mycothiol system anti-sigma-R factor [Smaragdicoccus niigatensis]
MSVDHDHDDIDCAAVLADISQLLDNECSESIRDTLRHHMDHCGPCLEAYGIEEQVKRLIGRKCGGERAPEGLRSRLQINIRSLTIRGES